MGRERTKAWQHFPLYFASLIFLSLSSCASLQHALIEADLNMKLRETRVLMQEGNFITARENNFKVLKKNVGTRRRAAALFNLGLIYAHYANPEKDYKKSIENFKQLIAEFPESPLSEEAKIWVTVFDVFHQIPNTTFGKFKANAYAGLHLDQSQLIQGDFNTATEKNEQIISLTDGLPPSDAALYNLGLIHAHSDNPKKDYRKALGYFKQLVQEFPHSPLREEAKIWLGLFETIEKVQQVDREIEEKKMELVQ